MQAAEEAEIIVSTSHKTRFSRVNEKLNEPEGKSWIENPIYAAATEQYWQNAYKNAKPLSADATVLELDKLLAMKDVQDKVLASIDFQKKRDQ